MFTVGGIAQKYNCALKRLDWQQELSLIHIYIYKWVFKTACAILILSNTFNIVMAVFDVSQSVIADAAGLIQGSTDITPDMLAELETTLEGMDLGPLLGLWLQSSVIGLTMQIMGIIIFVLVYGRMIEIYLMTSLAPLPVATLSNRELGGTGQNYLKSLFAGVFQGMLIPVSYTHLDVYKRQLLNMIGGIEKPDSGSIIIEGLNITCLLYTSRCV